MGLANAMDTPPARKGWRKEVDNVGEGAREVEGFSAKALLEEEGGVAKETRGGAGAKGGEGSLDCVR